MSESKLTFNPMIGAANVETAVDGDFLYLRMNIKHDRGPSPSGKTTGCASTLGNKPLPCGLTIGLNAYKPR